MKFFILLGITGLLLLASCGGESLLQKQAKHGMVVTYEFTQHKDALVSFSETLEEFNLLWLARLDSLDTLELSADALELVVYPDEINQLQEIIKQDSAIAQVEFRVGKGEGFSPHLSLLETGPDFQNLYEGWSFGFMELVNKRDSALWRGSAYPLGEDLSIDNCRFVRYDVLLFTSEAKFWIRL